VVVTEWLPVPIAKQNTPEQLQRFTVDVHRMARVLLAIQRDRHKPQADNKDLETDPGYPHLAKV
jgi:hypothetical protein